MHVLATRDTCGDRLGKFVFAQPDRVKLVLAAELYDLLGFARASQNPPTNQVGGFPNENRPD